MVVPKSNDYRNHSLVDKIDGLPYGNYLLIAQNTKTNDAKTVYSLSNFGVTSLHVNTRYLGDTLRHFFVTDNANGTPLKSVKIKPYESRYNASSVAGPTVETDQLGFSSIEDHDSSFDHAVVSYGKDSISLSLNGNRFNYKRYSDDEDDEKKVVLFTDRPIYRPGQIIYYKGLLLEKGQVKNKILTILLAKF